MQPLCYKVVDPLRTALRLPSRGFMKTNWRSEAISFMINCESQEEVDSFWNALSQGGEERPCGWLKDRYGLSWQVVPTGMEKMLNDSDQEKAQLAMKAMLGTKKIDIAELQRAFEGDPAEPRKVTARQRYVDVASTELGSRERDT